MDVFRPAAYSLPVDFITKLFFKRSPRAVTDRSFQQIFIPTPHHRYFLLRSKAE